MLYDAQGDTALIGGAPYSSNLAIGGVTCVSGCTDAAACNYDSTAVFDLSLIHI